jgi:archaeosortase A (PGF-CTERM-specific)
MLDVLIGALAWLHTLTPPLAWLVVGAFVAGTALEYYDRHREWARRLTVAAWVLFGLFWLSLIWYYVFDLKSFIEAIGAFVAVPLSAYVGYLLWQGRDSLFVLSRAIAVMGIVFLPFSAVPFLRQFIIETVTAQTEMLMNGLGFHPEVISGAAVPGTNFRPYRSTFKWVTPDGHQITYTIRIACTAVGSMAIFAGIVAAVRAPFRRKLRALAVVLPVIYALNLLRNVFIGVSFGKQYFRIAPDLIMTLFASNDPYKVSYFVVDRILAQSLSVVALVVLTWFLVRELPEVLAIIEDVLFVVTGSEYDLQEALGAPTPEGGSPTPDGD